MFFDTHAHYDDEQFDRDRDALLGAMQEAGVGRIVNPGCTVDSSRAAVALAARALWSGHKRGGSCSGCSGGCAGCSGCSGHGSQRS